LTVKGEAWGIFWVDPSSKTLVLQSYHQIAAELIRLVSMDHAEATVRVVKDHLERWRERWLLVFDNYDQPENFHSIRRFIPTGRRLFAFILETQLTRRRGGRGDVLFSTRHRSLARLAMLLEIPPMPTKEGVSLFLQGYYDHDTELHMPVTSRIVDRLGGFALAIDQAAAYLKHIQMPLDRLHEFLITYELQRKKVLKRRRTPQTGAKNNCAS
jgi:hypothetical protein